ncbi:hypothetical protein AEAC466_20645 [Asticcacaulis sp. AC466]|uniref:hypothetical protein n=1 Tax=Asticcacaulis sp. AC466 TaxID=1282362 RepID=UPI0003C3B1E4|nr:hypothetical protein [Asticcacaulis sp. AC466]ESQ81706.1 hypothetical protein AEAC466_20645 [Asticcacaulis sp. AC466]
MISKHVFVPVLGALFGALAVAVPGIGSGGTAQAAPADLLGGFHIVDCRTHDAAQENADQALASKALDLIEAHDIAKLNEMMPALKAALAHAPDVPAATEKCGDTVVVYTEDVTKFLALSAYLMSPQSPLKGSKVEQRPPLPYPLLAFIIGWTDYENQDFAAAHEVYVKGLKNDPDNHALIMEDTLTLAELGRSEEALTQLDAYMARNADLPDVLKAGALRKRGYVLVELHRWDEAEKAYSDSLVAEPGNEIAEGELEYIRQNRSSK